MEFVDLAAFAIHDVKNRLAVLASRADAKGDGETLRGLHPLDHAPTRVAVDAERAMLGRLEGGCQVPLGALATVNGNDVSLYAAACNLDGRDFVSVTQTGHVSNAAALGNAAASAFISKGGDAVLAQANARRLTAINPGQA